MGSGRICTADHIVPDCAAETKCISMSGSGIKLCKFSEF